jgi:hypothetical protein
MELQRVYYSFPVQEGVALEVVVTSGDTIEFGSQDLPFVPDDELAVGERREFEESFVLNVPGRSDVDVHVVQAEVPAEVPPEPESAVATEPPAAPDIPDSDPQ